MSKPNPKQHSIADHIYAIESQPQSITPFIADDTFWPKLMAGEIPGEALVSFYKTDKDFEHWEMHPNGDELFILMGGTIRVFLDDGNNVDVFELHDRQSCVIPKGVWHKVEAIAEGQLIIITYGAGTQHRPL